MELGHGEIIGKSPEGFKITVNDIEYISKKLLIATGSEPVLPPIPGIEAALTNREILALDHIPGRLAVIGGGAVGLEMASYFNSVGSAVTVIEMLDHIGGNIDREIASILQRNYEKKGVVFQLNTKVSDINAIPADQVLISVGRRPVTAGFGLENLSPDMDGRAIKTDEHCRTSVAGLYACGDVNGKSMLAHTAYREAEVAVNHMLGKRDTMRYHAIPSVIYTNPEVACVGETEETARGKGFEVKSVKTPMQYSGRYVAENNDGDGICKLVIDTKYNRLLGVHLIGSYASEMIAGAALMVETELPVDSLKELVFPHPTVSEVIREALFML